MPAEYGQHGPQQLGIVFSIAEGQAIRDAKVEMAATGTISGRVLDADGAPMGHVNVFALAARYWTGGQYFSIMQSVHTNQRGEYRLFWLPPDEYFVAASIEDMTRRTSELTVRPPGTIDGLSRADSPVVTTRVTPEGNVVEETYALVYNGGALDPAGTNPVILEPGMTMAGVDIPMGAGRLPSYRIHGVVIDNVTGQPVPGAEVRAFPREMAMLPNALVLSTKADIDGVFDLLGAVRGSYSVFATAAARPGVDNSSSNTTRGYALAAISGTNVDLKIVTSAAIPVQGRVTIEGRPLRDNDPELGKIKVVFRPDPNISGMGMLLSEPRGDNAGVNPNGTFTRQLYTGDYRVDSVWGFAPNVYLKSIRMGNVDLLDGVLRLNGQPTDPVEVTAGSDGGELTGVVVTQKSEPLPNAVVAIVPEAPSQRKRIDSRHSATTDDKGRFRLQGIPPGNYRLFAWEYAPFDAAGVPEFMQKYEGLGKGILVRAASRQEIEVTAIPARK